MKMRISRKHPERLPKDNHVSDIIDFLEKMGAEARLRSAPATELDAALADQGLEAALLTEILTRDQDGIEALVGARPNVCCVVYAPDEKEDDAEEEQEEEGEDGDEGEEEDAGKVKKPQGRARHSA
jgi:hypothetical protein